MRLLFHNINPLSQKHGNSWHFLNTPQHFLNPLVYTPHPLDLWYNPIITIPNPTDNRGIPVGYPEPDTQTPD